MKVSIISAVRNGEASIATTLRSVASQVYDNVEHVIIDGASTDKTMDVVTSARSPQLRAFSERDSGVYDAFNKGLRNSTGDIVGYLNSGDIYSSNLVIDRIVREFSSSSAAAIFGDVSIVDQVDLCREVRRYDSSIFNPKRIAYGFMPAHPTLFIRREIYSAFGGYDPSYKIAGDFELAARFFYCNKISYAHIPEVLVRMPRGGLSSNGLRSNWIITKEMMRACRQNGIATNYLKLALRFPIKLAEMFV